MAAQNIASNMEPPGNNHGQPGQQPSIPLDSNAPEYLINKNRFYRIRESSKADCLENHYQILLNTPLQEYSNQFSKAYAVSDTLGNPLNDLYAVVLNSNMPYRLSDINRLVTKIHPNFCNILSCQLVPISATKSHNLCLIVRRPEGITLRQYISENGPLSEKILTSSILPAINRVLEFFFRNGVVHGCLNPDTIFISENKEIVIKEPVSEPCGYSQYPHYEKIDRAYVPPIAKGLGQFSTDIFAFGMLSFYLHTGEDTLKDMSLDELMAIKFEQSTYRYLIKDKSFSTYLLDFLKGTLSEERDSVWTVDYTSEWLTGRLFNLLPPSPLKESTRAIVFMDKRFNSRKYLSYYMYKHWDEAKEFIRTNHLISWIDHNVQDKSLADRMESLFKRSGGDDLLVRNFDRDDILLIEYLLILDPQAPIRIKDIALQVDGIGDYFASQFSQTKEVAKKASNLLELILSYNFIQIWNDVCVTLTERGGQEAVLTMQKAREIFYKKEKGFGMTRCLYELNPTLCCQSPLIVSYTPLTIFHLLNAMEECGALPEDEILDEHMWAFLASKLELTVNVQLTKIQKYPELQLNPCIQTLSILSLAQEAANGIKLKNISTLFNQWLHTVVDVYHSRSIRYELTILIKKCAEKGNLSQLLRTVIDTKFILRDKIGFKRAVRQYQVNKMHMLRLNNSQIVYKVGYRYGLQLSVIISFLIAAITAIILMTKSL